MIYDHNNHNESWTAEYDDDNDDDVDDDRDINHLVELCFVWAI